MKPERYYKNYHSSDCFLQPENMKLESRVIVDKHATVKIRQYRMCTHRPSRSESFVCLKNRLFGYYIKST
jgi:hypothetical protein